jgi:hypothetical protein
VARRDLKGRIDAATEPKHPRKAARTCYRDLTVVRDSQLVAGLWCGRYSRTAVEIKLKDDDACLDFRMNQDGKDTPTEETVDSVRLMLSTC